MAIRILAFAIVGLLVSPASAAPCEPSANVSGDPDLVATVGDLLVQRGIVPEADTCPVIRARVERRKGGEIVVLRIGEPSEERVVSTAVTAATVIETWSRSDLIAPLLADHPLVVAQVEPPLRTPPALPSQTVAQTITVRPASRGLQAFGAMETSMADDRTSWLGVVVGVCVRLGRACASARGRAASVMDGPGMWGIVEREAYDLLLGGDIPFDVGSKRFSVGFGAGMGAVHTHTGENGMERGSETFGLRADAHIEWMIHVASRFSIHLSATIDVAQQTDIESSASGVPLADPRLFGRIGVGFLFGEP